MKSIHVQKKVILSFTETIAALLSSGLSIQNSLLICSQISTNSHCVKLCASLEKSILAGEPFYKALSRYEDSFTPLYISLVKLGEKTGSVASVFTRLHTYLQAKKDTRGRIVQALLYPVTVVVTAIAVSIFIVLFVFPRIQEIFDIFTAGNTDAVTTLQNVYSSIVGIGVGLSSVMLIMILGIVLYKTKYFFRRFCDSFIIRLPFVGTIVKSLCTNDFSFAMELLTSAGIPLVNSLQQAASVISNTEYVLAVNRVADSIVNGGALAEAFRQESVFPPYIVQWVGIGEKTGNPVDVFSQIHTYYEKENTHMVKLILGAVEPAFILIAGIIVIVLVVQFVLPLFSLLGEV